MAGAAHARASALPDPQANESRPGSCRHHLLCSNPGSLRQLVYAVDLAELPQRRACWPPSHRPHTAPHLCPRAVPPHVAISAACRGRRRAALQRPPGRGGDLRYVASDSWLL